MGLLDFITPKEQWEKYPPVPTEFHADSQAAINSARDGILRSKEPAYVFICSNTSNSMEPTMSGGDYGVITRKPYESLKEGDIISYSPKWVTKALGPSQAGLHDGKVVVIRAEAGENWVVTGSDGKEYSTKKTNITAMPVTHRLVAKDRGGWIASGDNNKHSESWERVTPETYRGVVTKMYRIKKPEAKKP